MEAEGKMTLRDLFNTIMDYPFDTEIQLDPWGLLLSFSVAALVLVVLYAWVDRNSDTRHWWSL